MLVGELKLISVFFAVLTPFNRDAEQSLNLSVIPKYANYLAKEGLKGVLIAGSIGEGPALSVHERKNLTEAWVKAVEMTKQHLMVQIGGAPFPDVIELARHAEEMKVGSLLALPELYFKPFDEKHLISYLKAISDAAPNTPLLYYHTPKSTNINIHMGKFLENVGNQVPTLFGIKFLSTDLLEGVQAVRASNRRFAVFLAGEKLTVPGYAAGMDLISCLTPNLLPELALNIRKLWINKNISEAQKYQDLINNAGQIISKYGSNEQGLKRAMLYRTGLDFGDARLPWKRNLSAKNESLMMDELETKIFSKVHQ